MRFFFGFMGMSLVGCMEIVDTNRLSQESAVIESRVESMAPEPVAFDPQFFLPTDCTQNNLVVVAPDIEPFHYLVQFVEHRRFLEIFKKQNEELVMVDHSSRRELSVVSGDEYLVFDRGSDPVLCQYFRVPEDLKIGESLELNSSTELQGYRVFIGRNVRILTHGHHLSLRARALFLEPGVSIRTFWETSRAPEGFDGHSGGRIILWAEQMEGVLHVVLQGQQGGHGRPGRSPMFPSFRRERLPVRVAPLLAVDGLIGREELSDEPREQLFRRGSCQAARPGGDGGKGGDSGDLIVFLGHPELVHEQIRVERRSGLGGQGGSRGEFDELEFGATELGQALRASNAVRPHFQLMEFVSFDRELSRFCGQPAGFLRAPGGTDGTAGTAGRVCISSTEQPEHCSVVD